MFGIRKRSRTDGSSALDDAPTTTAVERRNLAGRMGRWSAAHWKTATFGWIVFVVVAFGLGGMVSMKTIDPNTSGPGESGRMDRILEAGFKQPAGESVLIQSRTLRTTDPAFRAAIEDVVSGVSALRVVQNVRSPLEPGNSGQIAEDNHAALVEFQIRGDADKASEKIDAVVDRVDAVQQAHPQFFIGEFGNASAVSALDTVFAEDLEKAGLISLPITLIILVVAFGALVAAGIPLLLALTAVFATFGLGAVVSQVMPLAEESGALVLLIGLAVGVDYSMFYLKREREERAAGRSERAAIEAAAATSGHSVLVSGLTVMVAMAGLFLTRDATFASFGLATMMVVAIAMLGSLTVLPAILSKLGDRVDRLRVPFVGRLRRGNSDGRIWDAIIDRVLRRPVLSVVLAGGLLVALAIPAFQLKLVTTGPDTFPQSLPVVETYNRMQAAFPGTALPANVVVEAPDVNAPAVREAIEELEQQALATGRMHEPITVDVNRDGTVANVTIPIEGTGTDDASIAALALLRDEIVPQTVGAPRERRVRRHRSERAVEGLHRPDEVDAAGGVRVRPRVRVRAHARLVPVARDRGEGDPAQPALRGSCLRRAGARLPARRRPGLARLQLDGGHRPRGAAAPVRDPVRPLDGLPRARPRADPRGVLRRCHHGRGDLRRDQADGRRRDQRGDRDGRRVLDLRGALPAAFQAVRRGTRDRDPDRRDDRPRGAPARVDEAAGRLELVPAAVAAVASAARAARRHDRASARAGARLRLAPPDPRPAAQRAGVPPREQEKGTSS